MSECHDVEAILAWIPPRDRSRAALGQAGAAVSAVLGVG